MALCFDLEHGRHRLIVIKDQQLAIRGITICVLENTFKALHLY